MAQPYKTSLTNTLRIGNGKEMMGSMSLMTLPLLWCWKRPTESYLAEITLVQWSVQTSIENIWSILFWELFMIKLDQLLLPVPGTFKDGCSNFQSALRGCWLCDLEPEATYQNVPGPWTENRDGEKMRDMHRNARIWIFWKDLPEINRNNRSFLAILSKESDMKEECWSENTELRDENHPKSQS
jgi:hypothetical protein